MKGKLPKVLVGLGLISLVICVIAGWILYPNLLQYYVNQKSTLTPDSETWINWSNVPIPVYISFYVFNVTNPQEVEKGKLPKIQEVGPYTYREDRKKINMQLNDDGTEVSYNDVITYYFDEARSAGSENDSVTIINVPFIAISSLVSHMPFIVRIPASMYLNAFNETLFIQRNIGQLLFKGWHVPLIEEIQSLTGNVVMPHAMFGFYYGKNGTPTEPITISTGLGNSLPMGTILKFNNKTTLNTWEGECDKIRGTDGTIYGPFVDKYKKLELFSPDLCRSIHLTFDSESQFREIKTLRFTAPKDLLEDPKAINSPNKCYCQHEYECLKNGALNLAPCRQGVPVSMSTPHFLDGYDEYWNLTGLSPNKQKHETYLDLEPTTGLVLKAHKRIQINLSMKKVRSVKLLSKVPRVLFPILWADETASIDEKSTELLKTSLIKPMEIVECSKWFVTGLSCLLIATGVMVGIIRLKEQRKKELIYY